MSERETPTNDPELDADPRVLALLQRGTPANGIDLAPWWREHAAPLAASQRPKRRSLQYWLQFAAVFLVGIALGFVGGSGRASAPAGRSASFCQYTEKERADIFEVLKASAQSKGEDWSPRRAVALTLCSNCHNGRTVSSL
jgi:hypothetical protein